jgi:hypothetical protein
MDKIIRIHIAKIPYEIGVDAETQLLENKYAMRRRFRTLAKKIRKLSYIYQIVKDLADL